MKQLASVRIRSFLVCAGLATSLAACAAPVAAPAQPAAAPTIPELAIEFTGTEFKLPADVPGGIVALTINNTSGKPMVITVGRVNPGKTASDVFKWATTTPQDSATLDTLMSTVNSFSPALPGKSARVVTDLKTGEFIIDATEFVGRQPPLDAKHVNQVFKVGKIVGTVEPKADVNVEMREFALVMTDAVMAGKQVWKVSNTGKQAHMMLITKLNPGVNADDALKAFTASMQGPPSGPPPYEFLGGVLPISAGERQWIELDLQPGTYMLLCPLPDTSTSGGRPVSHLTHGMHKTLVVK